MASAAVAERLPLPSLRAFTAGSVAALAAASYHALRVADAAAGDSAPSGLVRRLQAAAPHMLHEPLCLWALVNAVCCGAVAAARAAALGALGSVRAEEAALARDHVSNYAFHKFMLVFGVLNVQFADELLLWAAWFAALGALAALAVLAEARNQHIGFSVGGVVHSGGRRSQQRVGLLGLGVALCALAVLAASVPLAPKDPPYLVTFIVCECTVVILAGLHAWAPWALSAEDARNYYNYIGFDTLGLVLEVMHVAHMALRSPLLLSLPALVLLLRLRRLLHALSARLTAHRRQARLHRDLSHHYPMASPEELKQHGDNCAICWEPMLEARRLPCQHLFHNWCLCQWVQQDASCPTCRRALEALHPSRPPAPAAPPAAPAGHPLSPFAPRAPRAPHTANHLFHFDGSRYVSWLPSFSVEVTRTRAPPPHIIEDMARQVQQLFPMYGLSALATDLAATHSLQRTVDNILEGRLPLPPLPPLPPRPERPAREPEPEPVPEMSPPLPSHSQPPDEETRPTSPPEALSDAHVLVGADDDDQQELLPPGPVEFSGEASERESLLARRKRALLAAARQRYLARSRQEQPQS